MEQKSKYSNCNNYCSIPFCGARRKSNISFHKFPKNEKIRAKWIRVCNIEKVTKHTIVCSHHFTKQDFFGTDKKRNYLKKTAVPSRNLKYIPNVVDFTNVESQAEHTTVQHLCNNELQIKKEPNEAGSIIKSEIDILDFPTYDSKTEIEQSQNAETIEKMSENNENTMMISLQMKHIKSFLDRHNFSSEQNNINLSKLQFMQCESKDVSQEENENEISSSDDEINNDTNEEINEYDVISAFNELKNLKCSIQEHEFIVKKGIELFDMFFTGSKVQISQLIKDDVDLRAFTGINLTLLQKLIEAAGKYDIMNKTSVLSLKDMLILCLCKLRLSLSYRCLKVLFGKSRRACRTIFYQTVNVLSAVMRSAAIYWPEKRDILNKMPICFAQFPQTRVILECIEISVKKPKCVRCCLALQSVYKGCKSMKVMLGLAPSGLITYVSNVYEGKISDKSIFEDSKLFSKLQPNIDAIMVDERFLVDFESENMGHGVQMIRPPNLEGKKMIEKHEALLVKNFVVARLHVERAIRRFKIFKILDSKIPWTMVPYVDNIVTVVAGLVNLSNLVLPDDQREM